MEKLLEVLIAIGDEVACLTVAEMILRHWPSHSRALYVKKTIEESEIVPFAPRGIDKLEPKHVRLKFLDKRKATDGISDLDAPLKRLKQRIELQLPEASWCALIDALLDVLTPLSEEKSEKELRSGDVQLEIKLPSSESFHLDDRGINTRLVGEEVSQGDFNTERENISNDKAASEDQPQERRSTRLGRLRSRKPEKEEPGFASSKDSDAVIKFLEPFIASRAEDNKDSERATSGTSICHPQACPFGTESSLLAKFVHENSKNYGAYHVAHLLLEEAARRNFICPTNVYSKLLELEKLTRNWGQDRTLECNIFLGELCYDFTLTCHEASKRSNSLSDASYHLCKVIESVSWGYSPGASDSINLFCTSQGSINLTADAVNEHPGVGTSLLKDNSPFWIRFFWLSGRLSVLDGNKAKAEKEFNISLSLFLEKENTGNSFSIHMPHCKTVKELTIDRVLYEINKLKMDTVMEKAAELIEKENYGECINSLAPVLFCTKDVCPDILPLTAKGDEISLTELSALDLLIKASEKTEPVDFDVCYNCHQRKLQILMATAGLQGSAAPGLELRRNSSMQWNWLVAEEVKAISQCISKVKTGQSGNPVTLHSL